MIRSVKLHGFSALTLIVLFSSAVFAADAPKKGKNAGAKGRLPPGYAQVVDDAQREKIYEVQSKYATKIAALKEQLKSLSSDRDAEVEAVLTAEQRQKIASTKGSAKPKKAGAKAAAKKKAAV